jgi:hypothetical protein
MGLRQLTPLEVRLLIRAAVFWAWSIAMTAFTAVLGGVPLKSLRRAYGRGPYWTLGVLTAFALFAFHLKFLAILYFSLVVLIGLFGEWEELGLSLLASAFFSLLITTLISAAGVVLWISATGAQWKTLLLARMDEWIKPALEMSPGLQVNSGDVLLQLPSIVIVLWMGALYLSVLLERRLLPPSVEVPYIQKFREELDKINIPNPVIWIFIVALLGAFGEFGLPSLQSAAVNVLNVCLVLFFFQGLAVVYRFFHVFRLGFFWQALLMVIIVGQLFLLVSLLGLVDHWVDFRARLTKRREEMNKELQ